MRNLVRNKNFYFVLFIDALLVFSSYFLSYFLRFEGDIPSREWMQFEASVAYIVVFKMLVFFLLGLYRGMWRYTSMVDLINVLKATVTSSTAIIVGIVFVYRFEGFPRSIFVIDWILTFIAIGGIRVAIRLLLSEKERGFKFLLENPFFRQKSVKPTKRLLIIGAGDAAEKMVREIRDNPRLLYDVVGFLDDDSKKRGMSIHGVQVLGSVSRIHDMAFRDEMDEILIAMPSASAKQMRRIVQACEATGLKCRTTPGIGELIDGRSLLRPFGRSLSRTSSAGIRQSRYGRDRKLPGRQGCSCFGGRGVDRIGALSPDRPISS